MILEEVLVMEEVGVDIILVIGFEVGGYCVLFMDKFENLLYGGLVLVL